MLTMSKNKKWFFLLMTLLVATFAFSASAVTGSITGYKFNDLNGNGVDNSEPRLPGFTITIQATTTTYTGQTVTDANGAFSFQGLPLGTYIVCEQLPVVVPPWIPTTPANNPSLCIQVILKGKVPDAIVKFGNWHEPDEQDLGCTLTQGYWKNHEAVVVVLLGSSEMALGTPTYTASELDTIFGLPPSGGNALINLAHQLIAAKLNVLNGADDTQIAFYIALADSLIGNLVPGTDVVTSSSALGQSMVNAAATLDNFNQGLTIVPHCDNEAKNL